MTMGAKMASTPGSIFQSASAGLGAGAPILMAQARERKAEDRDIRKGLLDLEAGRNSAAAQKAAQLLQMQQMGIRGQEAEAERKAAIDLQELRNRGDIDIERLKQTGRLTLAGARGSGSGSGGGGAKPSKPLSPTAANEVMNRAGKDMAASLKRMAEADRVGDMSAVTRASGQYKSALMSYNKAASDIGLPARPGDLVYTPNASAQRAREREQRRSNTPQVKNGIIIQSVTDLP